MSNADRTLDHADRRARVAVQVFARMRPDDDPTDAELTDIEIAAEETFARKICDLNWEAATLRRLGYHGETL